MEFYSSTNLNTKEAEDVFAGKLYREHTVL